MRADSRTKRVIVSAAVLMALAIGVLWFPAPATSASQSVCSPVPIGAEVTIDRPRPGRVPSTFTVAGRATASVPVSKILLLVDGAVVVTRTYEPSTTIDYEVSVGPAHAPAGSHTLQVVACGDGISLVRGISPLVAVEVAAPATSTALARTTTTERPAVTTTFAVTTTTAVRETTTTTADLGYFEAELPPITGPPSDLGLGSGFRSGFGADPISSGSDTSLPDTAPIPTENRLKDPVPEQARDDRASLTDAGKEATGRAPLWVGGVVGASGVAGLTLSGFLRRRSIGVPTDLGDIELL